MTQLKDPSAAALALAVSADGTIEAAAGCRIIIVRVGGAFFLNMQTTS